MTTTAGGGAKRWRFVEVHRGKRVEGKQVVLNLPSGTPEWDVYGRLLAKVQYRRGGRVFDLGSELLEAGLAVPYVPGGPDCLPPG